MATDANLPEDKRPKENLKPFVNKTTSEQSINGTIQTNDLKSNTHSTPNNKEKCRRKKHSEHTIKEKGDTEQGKGSSDKEEEGENQEGKEVPDPLSVDLYERLQAEKEKDESELRQWKKYNACNDLQKVCQKMVCTERQFYAILMSIFATLTFAMVFGLFVLQAQITMSSHKILTQVHTAKREIPEGMYSLYYDYLDSGVSLDKVDLRANTSIFAH